jgi:hypothetical protein
MPLQSNYTTPFRCAACGTSQNVYTGDPEDLTAPDVEAVECYKCGKVEVVCDPIIVEMNGADNLHTEKGIPIRGVV